MIGKIAHFIAKHPKTILIIATLLLIPAAIGYLNTFVNYDIMSYLPDSIESVQAEEILDKDFESAANAFLVVENMQPKEIVALKEKIADVEGVSKVVWTDDIVDTSIPSSILPDALTKIFYSSDKKSTLIMVQFSQGSATTSTMDAIKEIKTLLNKQCFLSGMSAIIEDTKELTDSEAPKYIAIAVVLALIALSFTMDSWVLPIVLLTSLGYAIVYNMGTNIFMPGGISYITQSIAAILQLGVTMDYSVFLMDRFNEEQKLTEDRTQAMANAISSTFMSLAGSSLTTVFGFLALCFMSLTLGLDIGIVMAKGVVLGVITVVVVLPTFMLLFYKPIYRFRHKRIIPSFNALNKFLTKHNKVFVIIFAILIIPSYIAKEAVPLDYNVSNALPEQLDSVQALSKLKTSFNMATTHFVIIHDDIPSGKVSEMIDDFEDVDGITGIISLNSFIGPAISEDMLPDLVKDLCFKDGYQLMMINSAYNTASDEENAQIDELTAIVKSYDPDGYITGEGVMSKDLINVTDTDFKVTSIISIAAIFILIAICLKSFTIPIFLVAAIELAIFINMAIALVTGADVSFIAPTIISCVQLGATVDYAILMTTRFREEIQKGKDRRTAMLDAANSADQSIFQSALVFFCATFGVYCVCNIDIVKNICSMLARGAVVSAIVIIIFLPSILVTFEGLINKTTLSWRKPAEKKFKKAKAEKKSEKSTKEGDKKPMKSSSILKKAVAVTMAVLMVLSMAACGKTDDTTETTDASADTTETTAAQPVYTEAPGSVQKKETVYINIDNTGSVSNINVTDWIHTDKAEVCVDDVSNLSDITSIKDDTTPVEGKDDALQWNMTGTDLYYSGTTTEKTPVSISLKYYLDGKEVKPENIIGKTGKVEIKINMTNNLYKEVKIDGKKQKIYLPVLVVGGFILPESEFSGVQVNGGRAIGDGTKEIAIMFGMPGLSESLGLDDLGLTELEGLQIGNTASVTADATDFELSNMYFAAVPLSTLNIDLDTGDSVDDLKSTLSLLKQVQDAVSDMDVGEIVSMFTSSADSAKSLVGVVSEAVDLYNSNKALIDLLKKYSTPENSEQIKKVLEFLTDENTKKAIDMLSDSVMVKFFTDLSGLSDAVPLADSFFQDLQDPEVAKAIQNLPDTLEKISEIEDTIDSNKDTINYLVSLLSGDSLSDITDLVSLLDGVDLEGFEEKYSSLVDNSGVIVERVQKWIEYGRSYKIFTKATDDMTTSVLFVYMTPSLEKTVTQTTTTTEESGESPIDEFIKKFK